MFLEPIWSFGREFERTVDVYRAFKSSFNIDVWKSLPFIIMSYSNNKVE